MDLAHAKAQVSRYLGTLILDRTVSCGTCKKVGSDLQFLLHAFEPSSTTGLRSWKKLISTSQAVGYKDSHRPEADISAVAACNMSDMQQCNCKNAL